MSDIAVGAGASAGEGKTILGHPRGLWWLFTIEMWERFGYYGMRALLILYLTQHFLFKDGYASGLYGAFTSLVYLTPLIGGLLADKYLGSRKAVAFGAILMTLGYFTLFFGGKPAEPVLIHQGQTYAVEVAEDGARYALAGGARYLIEVNREDGSLALKGAPGNDAFAAMPAAMPAGSFEFDGVRDPFYVQLMFIALALVIIGNGFFKPNISTMVGALYHTGDARRDSGFTIFYMGINLGSIISQWFCPLVAVWYGWNYGFLLAAIGMMASFVINEVSRRKLGALGEAPEPAVLREKIAFGLSREWTIYVLAVASAGLVWFLLQRQTLAGLILTAGAGVAFLGVLIYSIAKCTREERDRMIVAVVLTVFSILFWALFEQAGSSLTLYAERNTDRVLEAFNYVMPAGQVQIFNPLFVVLLAIPFSVMWMWLGKRGKEPSTPIKFSLGLVQVGLGFLILVYGAQFAGSDFKVPLIWLALAYFLHTTGELCLSPVGLSMITKLSVARLVGLMMGVWFLSSALAQYAGGVIAAIASTETVGGQVLDPAKSLATYVEVFQSIGLVAVAVGAVLFLLAPFLKKMMHGIN